jgi:hypothetical protein
LLAVEVVFGYILFFFFLKMSHESARVQQRAFMNAYADQQQRKQKGVRKLVLADTASGAARAGARHKKFFFSVRAGNTGTSSKMSSNSNNNKNKQNSNNSNANSRNNNSNNSKNKNILEYQNNIVDMVDLTKARHTTRADTIKVSAISTDEDKKSSSSNSGHNNSKIDEALCPTVTKKWSEIKKVARPSQTACGWDWTFYKLSNFSSEDTAQAYMETKPVPAVKYQGLYYVVDHHHTLAALELSGWDVKVTIEEIYQFEDDLSEDGFWGIMEGKGWSFCRDENYKRLERKDIPQNFELSSFRNDVFRSLGGFARKFGILKRGKSLEDRLFFEFQWGYFFWLHRSDKYGLWPSPELARGFDRLMTMIESTDQDEYIGKKEKNRDVTDMIELSEQVLQPLYSVLVQYIGPLAATYDQLAPSADTKKVPGLKTLFGRDSLPGSVDDRAVQSLIHINSLKNKKTVVKMLEKS